jgi:hypothetical protein
MLAAAPANTPQIKDSLELVKQQWFFFENASARKPVATNVRKRPWRRPVSVFLKKWKASWSLREVAEVTWGVPACACPYHWGGLISLSP